MDNTPSTLELVQQTYQAFGRGDIDGMLAGMTDDFVWYSGYPAVVPLSGAWRGHAGVLDLWNTIGASVEALDFQVREFITEGDRVVVLGFEEMRARATGRTYHNDWVHVWRGRDGRLAEVRTFNDTAAVAAAYV